MACDQVLGLKMSTYACILIFFLKKKSSEILDSRTQYRRNILTTAQDVFWVVGLGPVSVRLAPTSSIPFYTDIKIYLNICYNKSNIAHKIKCPIT